MLLLACHPKHRLVSRPPLLTCHIEHRLVSLPSYRPDVAWRLGPKLRLPVSHSLCYCFELHFDRLVFRPPPPLTWMPEHRLVPRPPLRPLCRLVSWPPPLQACQLEYRKMSLSSCRPVSRPVSASSFLACPVVVV